MIVLRSIAEVREWRRSLRSPDQGEVSVGFVPTMGALHAGHLSLIEQAKAVCDQVIVSVFVNPTQFGPNEDFGNYPRDAEGDVALAEGAGADAVWLGDRAELYPDGFQTRVEVTEVARPLCGASRPVHFGGVSLIVLKLFHIVAPHRAFFGRKDYQQLVLVRTMTRDLDLDIEIVGGETIREEDGLAMSSRNLRLTAEGREAATALYRGLRAAAESYDAGERSSIALLRAALTPITAEARVSLEYLELVDAETMAALSDVDRPVERPALLAVAAHVDRVRLIDNVVLGESAS